MKTQSVPTSSSPAPLSYAWLVVALLCVVACLNYLDRMMITTMRTSIIEAIPMSDAQFGLLTSVFLWIYGLLSPLAGFLADRFNRSKVIIASLFVWSIVTWLTSHATTFNELLLTRALMGISEACYIPAALALIVDYHRGSSRSLATGIHMAGVMVGQSLGFIGAFLAENHSWNFAFTVFGVIGVVYAVVLSLSLKDAPKVVETVREEKKEEVNFFIAVRTLFSMRAYRFALLSWGLLGIVSWLVSGWLPTYYKEHFNLSQTTAGLYATAYFFPVMLVGVLAGGAIADYWSRFNSRARIHLPALGLLIATPGMLLASSTDLLWLAVVGFMLYAFTRPFVDANMMPILAMVADSRYLATGYGILNMFSCLIGGVGIYAGGLLRDSNIDLSSMFQVAALTLLVCSFVLYRVKPEQPQTQPEEKELA